MYFEPTEQHFRKEREAARALRKSRWWQSVVAEAVCYYCNTRVGRAETTMDHIVPIAQGGRSVKGNVVLACKPCNSAKRDRTAAEWALEHETRG